MTLKARIIRRLDVKDGRVARSREAARSRNVGKAAVL